MARFKCNQKIYLLCTTGAIGDTCSTFPTLKILTERNHIEKMFVADRYFDFYKLFFDEDLMVPMSQAMSVIPKEQVTSDIPQSVIDPKTGEARFLSYPVNPNIPIVYTMQPLPSSIHSDMVDCFSMTICDAMLKEEQKNYPLVDVSKLPENQLNGSYVVITYGATLSNKRMLPETFNQIKQWFLDNGYQVVLLGSSNHELQVQGKDTKVTFGEGADFTGCINLINKTTIPEAIRIIYDAKCMVGIDSGLVHLAGLTDVPIIGAHTVLDPYYRLIYRHNIKGWNYYVVEPDSECRYCQSEQFETYGISFYRCNILTEDCVNSLVFDRYLPALEKWKDERNK